MLNRRKFLKTASLSAMAPSLCYLSCNDDPFFPIIDTHQHLWDLDLFPLKWVKPPLDRNFLMEDYLKAVEGQGVVKSIYMEVGVPPAYRRKEADWALELCKNPNNLMVGAVIKADPTVPEFESEITSLSKNPYLKGIRYSFKMAEEILLPRVIENIRLLGELGLSFDLNLHPRLLHAGNELLGECQGTQFVLNHCGGADPAAFFPKEKEAANEPQHDRDKWYKEMERLAQRANLICKLSGIVDNVGNYPLKAADLAPIINHCMEIFGPDRVVFAGDWPVCLRNMPLARWIETLKEVVANRSLADQRKLFHDNASAFYRV